MGEIFSKIWLMIFLLPLYIVEDGTHMFAHFLKKRGIYDHWDGKHTALVFFVILAIILYKDGFR